MNEQAISLLQQILEQQQKQTALLETIASQNLALIEALADGDGADPDAPPSTYLDGSPCR
ncbi:YebO family protein [Pseudomonas sp. RAC1]|uniref:YebO family protein n=1 Tax=Pseudomonas sp. RAC1 TaxID=3064900 RepID=UPI002721B7C4|nr:YebO family protein [Pseudomonas sp. RAC1]MDV9030559.1 YebO family protein [Pseudomonas sp. RAC1]